MQTTFTKQLLIAAAGIATMLTPAYASAVATYTDATVFGAMTQNMTLVTFDNLGVASGGYKFYYDSNGFTTSGVQFVGLNGVASYYTFLNWGSANWIDWGTKTTVQGPGGLAQSLRVSLPTGVTALGMNLMTSLNGTSAGGNIKITLSNGTTFPLISTASWSTATSASPKISNISPTWWGMTSDSSVSWLDISSADGAGYVVLDNFQFGSAAAPEQDPEVPEAATMILIGTGLAAMRFLGKFRIQHAV